MRRLFHIVGFLCLLACSTFGQDAVRTSATWRDAPEGPVIDVHFGVPAGYFLYADRLAVSAGEALTLRPVQIPSPKEKPDVATGEMVKGYDHDFTMTYRVEPVGKNPLSLEVRFQACDQTTCFLPVTRSLTIAGARAAGHAGEAAPIPVESTAAPASGSTASWQEQVKQFRVGGVTSGYLPADKFLKFLERAERGEAQSDRSLQAVLEQRGIWAACLVILIGGLLLNLTPCVLPMIPVNIAIIGAGVGAGSRWRGLALGSAYGVGIALVYGLLGVVVVLTGARFGTLNASPWFNLAIAAIFIVLALGMFDIIHIDFSRFQSGIGVGGAGRGGLMTAMFLGGIAALLAGACVAPVVIAVVLMATDLYRRGHQAGLLLPFLLGAGMALPWPLAGAGLSVLPRPGRWMERIKVAFGVIILLVALWYGRLGVSLLRGDAGEGAPAGAPVAATTGESSWLSALDEGLAMAQREGRPVFIDFWASWCKNCLQMDKTTFRDPGVESRLAGFVKVKFRAEDPSEPETKAVLDHFSVQGLPHYIVLLPVDVPAARKGQDAR